MKFEVNENINWQMKYHLDSLLKVFNNEEQNTSLIYHLCDNLSNKISWVASYAKTDEEKKFIEKCELHALKLYQKSLDYNYEKLKKYKDTKDETEKDFMYLSITIDKNGKPKKAKVISVLDGNPVFEDECTLIDFHRQMKSINDCIEHLSKWIKKKDTLKETLNEALKLKKQGPLGSSNSPSVNYDMDGMSREQRDAQAWENYVIETGRYHIINYDNTLDELIELLEKSIEFYQKAIEII